MVLLRRLGVYSEDVEYSMSNIVVEYNADRDRYEITIDANKASYLTRPLWEDIDSMKSWLTAIFTKLSNG